MTTKYLQNTTFNGCIGIYTVALISVAKLIMANPVLNESVLLIVQLYNFGKNVIKAR